MSTINSGTPSLQIFRDDTLLFSHGGKWLHPLFALEEFLTTTETDTAGINLRDRIIGKAAAMLILRMGIRKIHGELMSDLAADYLAAQGAEYSWGTRVDRIECRTEELFEKSDDIEAAYRELRRRAGLP